MLSLIRASGINETARCDLKNLQLKISPKIAMIENIFLLLDMKKQLEDTHTLMLSYYNKGRKLKLKFSHTSN